MIFVEISVVFSICVNYVLANSFHVFSALLEIIYGAELKVISKKLSMFYSERRVVKISWAAASWFELLHLTKLGELTVAVDKLSSMLELRKLFLAVAPLFLFLDSILYLISSLRSLCVNWQLLTYLLNLMSCSKTCF